MNWDLATILVLLMAISGLIWLFDILVTLPRRKAALAELPENVSEEAREAAGRMPIIIDLARSLFPVFLIVLMLRSFLVEPFRIPSGSMMPTLLVGDFILVNKFAYGIRLPVINTKIISIGEPQRGDVVVFRYPNDPSIPFIKRVIGLPGDRILYHDMNKVLYINGEQVPQEWLGTYQGVGAGSDMTGREERKELLPPDADHSILISPVSYSTSPYHELRVPEGRYFVLGDNRDNSRDSRFWGTVPEENLIGKAFLIWMNWDWSASGVDWERLGQVIE